MEGYFPMALRKFVYVYAAFLVGKKSLNFDSGKTVSTFFTFCGLLDDPGLIASTRSLSRVQDVVSRRVLISSVIGSVVATPQRVPEQLDGDGAGVGTGAGGVGTGEGDGEPIDLLKMC